ncbi:MAG: co-chaperone GroES [Proteobacteria bacterium]|nr:co-chaperone GroES [Pseudomonadota bacterium]
MTFKVADIRPLHDRVLVERIESEHTTAGGIIIPDTAKEKPVQGKVVAVGQGHVDDSGKIRPLDVKAGDIVLFAKWGGTEVKIEGQEYLIMKESDILAILRRDA